MKPYRIIQATLTTYSGRKHTVDIKTEILTKPLRIVKDKILDSFCKTCNNTDPFVRIDVKTEPLFNSI